MNYSNELEKQLFTSLYGQMDSSMKISEILTQHSDSNIITEDLVVAGLIYRLTIPMTDNELNSAISNAKKIMKDIEDECINEEEEDDDECREGDDSDNIMDTTPRKLKMNTCNCDLCNIARVCVLNFNSYEPSDQLAHMFKDSIQKTCDKFNIIV